MLASLTQYLIQYRQVAIPYVGTVSIATESAELKFIEKLLIPPKERFRFSNHDEVNDHQIAYLMISENADAETVRSSLENVGKAIHQKMSNGSFEWNGIGKFSGSMFIATDENLWQPVPAQKVHRLNPEHSVLIGDRQTTAKASVDTEDEEAVSISGRKLSVQVIAWVVLALGIAAILWMLISGQFNIYSFGLQSSP